jgi:DNA-binding transcriptional LysR family regulator
MIFNPSPDAHGRGGADALLRRVVDFPYVLVRLRCDLSKRAGAYRLNNLALRIEAALAGCGLAYLPEDQVRAHMAQGRLLRVLGDWCPPYTGYHLYYPSRRHQSAAFATVVEALRQRK